HPSPARLDNPQVPPAEGLAPRAVPARPPASASDRTPPPSGLEEMRSALAIAVPWATPAAEPAPPARQAAPVQERSAVQRLLARAEAQMADLRLTTPAGDNALETYEEVLTLVPGHEEALAGIRRIGLRYVDLARWAARNGQVDKVRLYADKAL